MKKISLLLSAMCFSSTAFAFAGGTGVSDGGHGVVCGTDAHKTVQLLDSLEAQTQNGISKAQLEQSVGPYGGPFIQRFEAASEIILGRAAEALGAEHPFVGNLREQLRLIETVYPVSMLIFSEVRQTYDYGQLQVKVDPTCAIVQLAVRTEGRATTQLVTNVEYWSKLSEFDQYALLVHEALHAWFTPEVSTSAVRQANAFLLSTPEFRSQYRDVFKALVETKQLQK
jgi:hypothetical protein